MRLQAVRTREVPRAATIRARVAQSRRVVPRAAAIRARVAQSRRVARWALVVPPDKGEPLAAVEQPQLVAVLPEEQSRPAVPSRLVELVSRVRE